MSRWSNNNNNPLFPVPSSRIVSGFTTAVAAQEISQVTLVPLTNEALSVHRFTTHTMHTLVIPPDPITPTPWDPSEAWEAFYPLGSINPSNKVTPQGGFGFYLSGPEDFAESLKHESVQEIIMSYSVMFEEGWEWQLGGKLPGIYGGVGISAYGCSGGRQTERCRCFSLRLMWRKFGDGELYTYILPKESNAERLKEVPPKSFKHADYGFSVGRGAWRFTPGKWTSVAERVKLNTVGQEDGEIEVFIDSNSVICVRGLTLRDSDEPNSHFQGMQFETFFGGHDSQYASPQDQKAYFANISGAILAPSPDDQHAHEEL